MSSLEIPNKIGCYAPGVNLANPIEIPLKSFHYDVDIFDSIAQVKMQQIYRNQKDRIMDVEYVFPVPPQAAISKLEYQFNGIINQAIIVEKAEAQRKYNEGLNEGRAVVYGGINANSKDYMKLKIGNIERKQQIKINLIFVQKVSLVYNSFYEFRLQNSMTPRYGARLNQNQIAFQPNYKSISINENKCIWGIKIRIKSSKKLIKVESLTHNISSEKISNHQFQIKFKENNILPNKDFALLYTFQGFQKPSYAISHNDNKSSAVISFVPKFCKQSVDDVLNQVKLDKRLKYDLNSSKGEYIFVLDRSGSMQGIRIQRAIQALIIFLKSLPEDSYFNIVSFGNNYEYLFKSHDNNRNSGKSRKYTNQNVKKAIDSIEKMTADMGGTQILNPLANIMTIDEIKGYPRLVFLLTDGAVSNVTSVLKFIKAHTQYTRVSSIGIGNGCSRDLIQNSAKKGRGYSTLVDDQEDPSKKIINVLQNSLTPIISDLKLTFDKTKVESIVPNPQKMPYILKNDLANFYITFNGKLEQNFKIEISYRDSFGINYQEKIIISPSQGIECNFINKIVGYQKINALVQTYTMNEASEQRIFFVKQIDKKKLSQQIIKESIQNQILTQLTAFVCIDSNLSDQIAKKIAKQQKQLQKIRSMIPHDHVEIKFLQQGYDDDSSDEYIDECCINENQFTPLELENQKLLKQKPKPFKQLAMLIKKAWDKKDFAKFNGITKWPYPQKRLIFSHITKTQQIDGSWTQNFTESLQNTQNNGNQMYQDFKSKNIPDKTINTIIVYFHIKRLYSKYTQYNLVQEKAKNYIIKSCKSLCKWEQIQKIYQKYYNYDNEAKKN